MTSPHLPPDACNVVTHYRLQSLWKTLFVVFIGFLSGICATFVAVAWIVPQYGTPTTIPSFNQSNRGTSSDTPDTFLSQQTEQRILTLFDSRKKVAKKFYPESAFLGEAALLSSDGWAVVYDPDNQLPDTSLWDGVDHQGISHTVLRTVRDTTHNLIYVQFSGEGFRIMSFVSFDDETVGDALWSLSRSTWARTYAEEPVRLKEASSIVAWQEVSAVRVLPLPPKKSILLSNSGALYGFASSNGIVVPAWLMDYELGSILTRGTITFNAVSWKGFFVTKKTDGTVTKAADGFYIESAARGESVKAGDLVTRVNGKSVTPERLSHDLLTAPDQFTATVLRGETEIEVTIRKSEVK